jgi:D-alanine-D-alanine ligase
VLEINTNPCLSPDAGFAAALQQAKIKYHDAIGLIIDNALK